ncbi:MAG: GGDEF domain-containing protein [Eubacterium sp.]|nr:GGDEF domain-containing protein [Eubacterium sp.]
MKKKIAVFTNGWNDEYLDFALEGVRNAASKHNMDVFVFLDYTSYDKTKEHLIGELNILNLPDLNDFSGALLLGNTLCVAGEIDILRDKILEVNIPAVCLEALIDDIDCIRTENINGMKELVEHLVTVHGVKDIFWVGGPSDNVESIDRYNAVKEVMEGHGLAVDPKKQVDGSWSFSIIQTLMPDILEGMDKLPDAFICANDVMAMGVCLSLDKAGYKVPDDVIVTGFDNLHSGSCFSPTIASVDRGWGTRSYQATEHLISLMNGGEHHRDIIYNSTFDPGESCGCPISPEDAEAQKEGGRRTYSLPLERTVFDWHLLDIDECVSQVKSIDELHDKYNELWFKNHAYEGDSFALCVDHTFMKSMENETPLLVDGYSKKMDVLFCMVDGKCMPQGCIYTKDLVPFYNANSENTNLYMFIPLHNRQFCEGYFVIKNNHKVIKDFYLNSLISHISASLDRGRQNIKLESMYKRLEEISVKDELTGLLNRLGYEKLAIPYLEELRESKKKAIIMVADINRMKLINDKYGHLHGDNAIKITANALKKAIPKEWKAVRYGGDEYVIIGEAALVDNINKVKKKVIEYINQQVTDLMLPFKISVSIGYINVVSDSDLSMEECFRMADDAMYHMKEVAHKQESEE